MAFLLTVPEAEEKRRQGSHKIFNASHLNIFRGESVEAVLAKEIQLKHMAPVIDIEASTNLVRFSDLLALGSSSPRARGFGNLTRTDPRI